jgi:hypothetical protein
MAMSTVWSPIFTIGSVWHQPRVAAAPPGRSAAGSATAASPSRRSASRRVRSGARSTDRPFLTSTCRSGPAFA